MENDRTDFLKHFNYGKIRSNNGCWTCRLRRKKCDESRPACEACRTLEITCHFEDEKPPWMDGGPKQKAMGESVKAQVKKQASSRRDRRYLDMLEAAETQMRLDDTDKDVRPRQSTSETRSAEKDPASHTSEVSDASRTSPSSGSDSGTPHTDSTGWHQQPQHEEDSSADFGSKSADENTHSLVSYMDYVFPYFFPFYRPSLLLGGRSWLMEFMQKNPAVYHTALSLTTYFYATLLHYTDDKSHAPCVKPIATELQYQLRIGLSELQKHMQIINADASVFDVREGISIMQSMLHMLVLEVVTSNRESWRMHLAAATAMFIKILPSPELWLDTLQRLSSSSSLGDKPSGRPWSMHQGALRFYAANLFHLDVLASITLETSPRLMQYQSLIIPTCDEAARAAKKRTHVPGPLSMDDNTGLYNYTVQLLSDVSALDTWKKQQRCDGTLSLMELEKRGQVLADALESCIAITSDQCCKASSSTCSGSCDDFTVPDSMHAEDITSRPSHDLHNLVWLQATLLYLQTVTLGWQPDEPRIRKGFCQVKALLQSSFHRAVWLRTVVWPICVTGCLSVYPEEEDGFRAIMQRVRPLRAFGTMNEALAIMEKVWASRETIDESWSVAQCLNVLGHGSLLI